MLSVGSIKFTTKQQEESLSLFATANSLQHITICTPHLNR